MVYFGGGLGLNALRATFELSLPERSAACRDHGGTIV